MGHEQKMAKTFDSYLSIELLGGGLTKTIQHQRDKGSRAGNNNFVSSGHWNEVLI